MLTPFQGFPLLPERIGTLLPILTSCSLSTLLSSPYLLLLSPPPPPSSPTLFSFPLLPPHPHLLLSPTPLSFPTSLTRHLARSLSFHPSLSPLMLSPPSPPPPPRSVDPHALEVSKCSDTTRAKVYYSKMTSNIGMSCK